MLNLPPALHLRTRDRVTEWAASPDVVGVVWVGSRSRGLGDATSDDDLEVLLTPAAFARVAPVDSYEMAPDPDAQPPRLFYDAQMSTLEVLTAKAGSPRDLDHWPYERAVVLFDRDGRVADAVRAAAAMSPEFRRARLRHGALDAVAAIDRAKKTDERGFRAAHALLVARAAKALSRVPFALEDRWVPLDHWLEPELATLADPEGTGPLLIEALTTGSCEPLAAAMDRLQSRLGAVGFPPRGQRATFFSELMHPSTATERMVHGLN